MNNIKQRRELEIDYDNGIVRVPLTKGYTAIVDIEDLDVVQGHNWSALHGKPEYYPARNRRKHEQPGPSVILLHREILTKHYGDIPDHMESDHINRDPMDNRLRNLRLVTKSENQYNRNGWGASKFKGVSICNTVESWRVYIKPPGSKKPKYVGSYKDELDAARAYDREVEKYWPNQPWMLNLPEEVAA